LRSGPTPIRGLPHAQADAGAIGLLHARLVLQSVVNAFADTFAYQAAIGALALSLVIFFARGRTFRAGLRWVVQMTR
jgi:hypothetical protein